MIPRILRRVVAGLITVACVYTVTFIMVVSIPGNPFQTGSRNMPPEARTLSRTNLTAGNFIRRGRGRNNR